MGEAWVREKLKNSHPHTGRKVLIEYEKRIHQNINSKSHTSTSLKAAGSPPKPKLLPIERTATIQILIRLIRRSSNADLKNQ